MKRQFGVFLLRWALNSFGLWIAVRIFGDGYHDQALHASVWTFLLAGLIFSIVNAVVRPVLIILSLPAILVTLGLFILIVNGIMVYISLALAPHLHMTFGYSILTGIVLSLVNYIVSGVLELRYMSTRRNNS